MTIKSLPILALLFGNACGASQRRATAITPTDAIRAWIAELPTAYETGDPTIFDGRVDPDGLFISTAPEEVWDAPTFVDLHHDMLRKVAAGQIRWKLAIKDVVVGESPDKKSAWMSMEVDWRFGDHPQVVPSRWSGVMVERDGTWALSASEVSFAVANAEALELAGAGKLVAGKPIADHIDPGAEPLVAMFDRDCATRTQLAADLSERRDVSVTGTDPREHMVDGAAIKHALEQLGEAHESAKRDGVRAHLVAGGRLGWVMANVEDRVETKPGVYVTLPLRALAVYVREAGGWKLVLSHTSLPVPNA